MPLRPIRTAARFTRPLAAAALLAAALGSLAAQETAPAAAEGGLPRVLTVAVTGPITGGTVEILAGARERARVERHDAILIVLDTPGGQLDATREIVQAMLASELPILVWVGPGGARAGSAGVFLTLAADVAAMHPTSNIGAAHPVTGSGRDVEAEAGKEMAKKVENDTAAFARSVAAAKGRNADWAEKAVRESVSITAEEAVKQNVADLTAPDVPTLFEKVDGRKVTTAGGARTLQLAGAIQDEYVPNIRQRVLSFLANPNVVALLTLLGMLGIAIEFYNPGAIVPGVVGALCLFLSFMAMRVIPVNAGAVLLILVGVGLMVAEAYLPTSGIAAAGGAACLLLGTLFFVDTTSLEDWFEPSALRISPWVLWPTPIILAVVLAFMGWKVASGRKEPLHLGSSALVGAPGEALSDVGPDGGEVFVHGEYWQARSAVPIPRGAHVRVVAVAGLTVTVVADGAAAG